MLVVLALWCISLSQRTIPVCATLADAQGMNKASDADILRELKRLNKINTDMSTDKIKMLDTIDELKREIRLLKEENNGKSSNNNSNNNNSKEKKGFFTWFFSKKYFPEPEVTIEGCSTLYCCMGMINRLLQEVHLQMFSILWKFITDPLSEVPDWWKKQTMDWSTASAFTGGILLLLLLNAFAFLILEIQKVSKWAVKGVEMVGKLPLLIIVKQILRSFLKLFTPTLSQMFIKDSIDEKKKKELEELNKLKLSMEKMMNDMKGTKATLPASTLARVPRKTYSPCNFCGRTNHHSRDCYKAKKCSHCGQKTHKEEHCPTLRRRGLHSGSRDPMQRSGRSTNPEFSFPRRSISPQRERSPARVAVITPSEITTQQEN